ncbi:MAG: glycoside hydrolase family 2 protein, partial [Eubacteriales bacterium]
PKLENVLVLQEHERGEVTLVVTAETEGVVPDGVSYRAEIISPLGERVSVLSDDAHFRIQIKDPLLWWPNGYGEQPLYSLRVSVVRAGTELSSVEKTIGLRTITVSRERDEWGREFCFEVNGKKIFAMGADYIPEDNILPRITAQRSEKLIQSCAMANFNCLRIWGGGFYPSDEFYELCDRYGIILWQDFMFACLNVWLNSDFEENVVNEIRDVLLRIRHHACVGLICGNNEMEMAFCEWKIPKDELVKSDYLRLYERIMPDMCEKYAPQIFYWPSSPSCGGGFDDPNSADDGDAHYWEVWLRNAPMESYNDYYFRFCSEFGFESFPDRKTVRYYTGGVGENPLSDVIEFHQKREQASVKLVTYAADNFLYASDFDNFVYTTQIVQGEAIQYAVEHMRRFRGRCMGAVYWQLNDSWPGQTWSSVDYFGRWKALHYFARRFFARQTVFAHKYGDKTVFVASNETLGRFEGRCRIRVKNNAFEVLCEENIDFSLPPLSSEDIKIFDTAEVMQGLENQRFFEYTVFDRADRELFNGAFVCIKNKFYHYDCPHISYSLEKDSDTYVLRLCARAFARYVEISSDKYDLISDDNYFDITDNGVRSVKISAPGVTDASDLENSLKIRCVYDIDK